MQSSKLIAVAVLLGVVGTAFAQDNSITTQASIDGPGQQVGPSMNRLRGSLRRLINIMGPFILPPPFGGFLNLRNRPQGPPQQQIEQMQGLLNDIRSQLESLSKNGANSPVTTESNDQSSNTYKPDEVNNSNFQGTGFSALPDRNSQARDPHLRSN